jgi:hypothetical protein
MPPYIVIIFINIYIIPFVGNGPLWDVYHKPEHFQECRDYLWAKIFLLNNFFGANVNIVLAREVFSLILSILKCMEWLWYVPNDFQMYCLSPIFLIILFK